jgi:cytochrome oxidase assembly protein ShyY1
MVLSLAMGTLTFNLGQWQTRRAAEKSALQTQREQALAQAVLRLTSAQLDDPAALRFRRVSLEGQFIDDAWVALDNRQIKGRPAVAIVQAFRVQPGGFVVAVDRGLLARDMSSPRSIPELPRSDQTVRIEGFVLERFARTAELWGLRVADASDVHRNGREWSNFHMTYFATEYAQQLQGADLGNFVVQQLSDSSDGLVRVEPQWSNDVGKHKGYAFQWYSLTALLAVWVGVLLWREMRSGGDAQRGAQG